MLLRELLKHTSEGHIDYANLSQALAKIRELNEYINERKRQRDNQVL